MPLIEYSCKDNHVKEVLFKTHEAVTKTRKCEICGTPAERIVSRCAIAFQPYAFSTHGFATHSDRAAWIKSDEQSFGGAHTELAQKGKDVGSRQWTHYKGKNIKKV